MAWLTRFGGNSRDSSYAGIAFQGSLSPVNLPEGSSPDTAISSPLAAMVASPRTAVTQGQQSQNVDAQLPAFKPGEAPTVVPESHAIGAGMLAVIVLGGLWLIAGMKGR